MKLAATDTLDGVRRLSGRALGATAARAVEIDALRTVLTGFIAEMEAMREYQHAGAAHGPTLLELANAIGMLRAADKAITRMFEDGERTAAQTLADYEAMCKHAAKIIGRRDHQRMERVTGVDLERFYQRAEALRAKARE